MLVWRAGCAQTQHDPRHPDASAGSGCSGNKDTKLLVLRRRLRRGFWRWRKVLLAHIHRLPVAAREPHINSIPFGSGKSVLVTLVRLFVLADRDLHLVRRHCRSVRAFYIFLQACTCDTSTGAFVCFRRFWCSIPEQHLCLHEMPAAPALARCVVLMFCMRHSRAAHVPAGNASDAGIGVFKRDFVQGGYICTAQWHVLASGIVMHEEILEWVQKTLDDKLKIDPNIERIDHPYLVAIVQEVDQTLRNEVLAHDMFYKVWEYKNEVSAGQKYTMQLFSLPDFTPVRSMYETSTQFSNLRHTFYDTSHNNEIFLHNSADVVFNGSSDWTRDNEDMYNDIGVRCIVMKGEKIELKWYNLVKQQGGYACFQHNSLSKIYTIQLTEEKSNGSDASTFREMLGVHYDRISTPLTLDELLQKNIRMPFSREVNYLATKSGQSKLFCDSMFSILAAAQHICNLNTTTTMTLSQAVRQLVVVYFGAGQPNPNAKTHHLADVLRFFPDLRMIMYDTNEMDFELNKDLLQKDVAVTVKDANGNYAARVVSVNKKKVLVERMSRKGQKATVNIADVELARVDKRYKMITEFGAEQLVDELKQKGLRVCLISDIRSGVAPPIRENDIARHQIAKMCAGENRSSASDRDDLERIEKLKSHFRVLEEARAEMVFNDMIFQMQMIDILKKSGLLVYSSIKIATDYQDLSDPEKIVYVPKDMHLRLQSFIPSTEIRAGQFHDPTIDTTERVANSKTKRETGDNSAPIKGSEYIFSPKKDKHPPFYVETTLLDFSAPEPEDYSIDNVTMHTHNKKRLYVKADAQQKPKNPANVLRVNQKYYRPCFPQEHRSENGLRELYAKDVDDALMYIHSADRTHAGCNNAPIRLMLMLYHKYAQEDTKKTEELIHHVNKQHMTAIQRAVKHIDHSEVDDYLMSSNQKIPTFELKASTKLKPDYLKDSIKRYNRCTQTTEILDMRECFLNVILSAEQMPAEKLKLILLQQDSKLLARIWLHINDQFRFFTHACYQNLKDIVQPPQLADLPGSTGSIDTLAVQDAKKRRSMCIDWFCYWLHNLGRIADIEDNDKVRALFRSMSNVLVLDSNPGQPLTLDVGLHVHKLLYEWPVSKPVFFVAISHGLLPMVQLCFRDAQMNMLPGHLRTRIMEQRLNKAGYTYHPLPYAVYYATRPDISLEKAQKYVEIIRWMLTTCRFDVNKANMFLKHTVKHTETALDIALRDQERKNQELVDLLLEHRCEESTSIALETPSRDSQNFEAMDTQELIELLEGGNIPELYNLNKILRIGVQRMDATLVRLAVRQGASDNQHTFITDFDNNKSHNASSSPETELQILVYVACANFHRLKQQTFDLTEKIIWHIEALKFGTGANPSTLKDEILRKIVTIRHRQEEKNMSLIDWAYYAEDYFAVGLLKNMGLTLHNIASEAPGTLLPLVLKGNVKLIRELVKSLEQNDKRRIATGYTDVPDFQKAVYAAIGNYQNIAVLNALNVKALAIATYLHRFKFNIVREILSNHKRNIQYLNNKLAVWKKNKDSNVTIVEIRKLLAKIDKQDEKDKIKGMLEDKGLLSSHEIEKILKNKELLQSQITRETTNAVKTPMSMWRAQGVPGRVDPDAQ